MRKILVVIALFFVGLVGAPSQVGSKILLNSASRIFPAEGMPDETIFFYEQSEEDFSKSDKTFDLKIDVKAIPAFLKNLKNENLFAQVCIFVHSKVKNVTLADRRKDFCLLFKADVPENDVFCEIRATKEVEADGNTKKTVRVFIKTIHKKMPVSADVVHQILEAALVDDYFINKHWGKGLVGLGSLALLARYPEWKERRENRAIVLRRQAERKPFVDELAEIKKFFSGFDVVPLESQFGRYDAWCKWHLHDFGDDIHFATSTTLHDALNWLTVADMETHFSAKKKRDIKDFEHCAVVLFYTNGSKSFSELFADERAKSISNLFFAKKDPADGHILYACHGKSGQIHELSRQDFFVQLRALFNADLEERYRGYLRDTFSLYNHDSPRSSDRRFVFNVKVEPKSECDAFEAEREYSDRFVEPLFVCETSSVKELAMQKVAGGQMFIDKGYSGLGFLKQVYVDVVSDGFGGLKFVAVESLGRKKFKTCSDLLKYVWSLRERTLQYTWNSRQDEDAWNERLPRYLADNPIRVFDRLLPVDDESGSGSAGDRPAFRRILSSKEEKLTFENLKRWADFGDSQVFVYHSSDVEIVRRFLRSKRTEATIKPQYIFLVDTFFGSTGLDFGEEALTDFYKFCLKQRADVVVIEKHPEGQLIVSISDCCFVNAIDFGTFPEIREVSAEF